MPTHIDQEYEAELAKLRETFLSMGRAVEEMIAQTVAAFVENDTKHIKNMSEVDNRIDALEVEGDALCLALFARRQPVASDLRFVAAAFKSITVLERVGDHAVTMSDWVIELKRLNHVTKPRKELSALADAVRAMFHDVLEAFAENDADKARAVIAGYDTVSALFREAAADFTEAVKNSPDVAERSRAVEAIAKSLKRIGGHAMNLAEMVVFIAEGKDIRHAKHLAQVS